MTNKPFCYAPWVSLIVSGIYKGGGLNPCCEWEGDAYPGTLDEYLNSNYLKNIKQSMIDNNMSAIHETCKLCIDSELNFGKSRRTFVNKNVDLEKYDPNAINFLDYRIDNLCNLKCIMCSSDSSNLINKEMNKNFGEEIKLPKDTDYVYDLDLVKLKTLALIGGEPTINKKLYKFLDHLIEKDLSKNIHLHYTTNCVSINKKWIDRTSKFKEVHTVMSLDAAGPAYEYIRNGASWDTVKNNVPLIIDKSDNYDILMVAQVQSFAIIEEWIEYFFQFPHERVLVNDVYGVPFGIDSMPNDIKLEKIEKLKKMNHPLADKIIKFMEEREFNLTKLKKFKERTLLLDSIRKTNLRNLNPVFERIFNTQY